jgi:hypothetical protein
VPLTKENLIARTGGSFHFNNHQPLHESREPINRTLRKIFQIPPHPLPETRERINRTLLIIF